MTIRSLLNPEVSPLAGLDVRPLLINLFAVLLTAAAGFAICRAASIDPHVREMLLAGGAILFAAELAIVPMWSSRRANQADVSQAGLIATVLHMFVAAGVGGAISMLLHPHKSFLWWLLSFYWVTLITVCGAVIVAIRSAQPAVQKPSST